MIRRQQLLMLVATTTFLALLTACGQNTSTGGGSTPPPTPTPTPTATTGPVTLHVGAASYHAGDTIEVTLQNASTSTIYFPDHLTNCTVIQLLYQVNGRWESVNKCQLMIHTSWHTLDAGQSLTVHLVPNPSHPWPVGLYQATLNYRTSRVSVSQTSVYSAGFQVT
jgi:hypothetical protein